MIKTEMAYVAGIIESKGSIMLLKDNLSKFPSPTISISSTSVELLEYISSIVANGYLRKRKGHTIDTYKDYYELTFKRDSALCLLECISPYLVTPLKKAQTLLILTNYKDLTPRNGKYTPEILTLKEDFYNEFFSLK